MAIDTEALGRELVKKELIRRMDDAGAKVKEAKSEWARAYMAYTDAMRAEKGGDDDQ